MEILENKVNVEERIFTIRGKQVILDRDLARLYGVDISQMNINTCQRKALQSL